MKDLKTTIELVGMSIFVAILMNGCMISSAIQFAHAAEITLPVTVTIVQCGKRDQLVQACQRDPRCCVLIKK